MPKAKLTPGAQVKILSGKGCISEMFVGKVGTIFGKCGLYPNGVLVRVEGWTVSYYPNELEVVSNA